ncbi:hypothetical protein CK203_060022 [Vitis vinifera]|uniref:Reverse transcriptase Ty1/copia-type domain-containing protein n=1 Tax=Vitis vinifera TaxID=29760 RepID=A0A438GMQ6_VITVI|nr:hypothetical protein CK203_060022 [Vitis vinifera]
MAAKLSGRIPDVDIRVECRRQSDGIPTRVEMSYDSRPGGMSRIPYSLYSGFAYGFQRTLLNLGLLCEFEMSMIGELNFFLGLQIKQLKEGTFINQAKYIRDLLKRFNMEEAKTMKTPMSSSIKLDMDEKGKSVNSTMYRGMIGGGSRDKKMQKIWPVDQAVDRFVGAGNLKRPPTLHFSPVLLHTLKTLHIPTSRSFRGDFSLTACLKLGFNFISMRLGLRVGVLSLLFDFILPLDFSFSLSRSLDDSKARDEGTSRAQGKRPVEPSQPEFEGLFGRMGWLPVVTIFEPIFLTLVWAFYSLVTYGLGGPILSTVRGVEIRLSPKSICRILDIPLVGLRVCPGDGQTIGTQPDRAQSSPSSHDLLHLIATSRTSRRGLLP